MIEVKNLSKTFKVYRKKAGFMGSVKSLFNREWINKQALKDVSFSIQTGEIVGLVGANGAGKTTLVKILSGIVHPTAGEIKVLGYIPWKRDNRMRRQISLVMGQKAQLWWDLPAADCFLLLKEIYQITPQDYKMRLQELTEVLDVGDQINIPIRRLSLGERMKMELMATMLHKPKVIFLDEPTIGLDLSAQRAVRNFLIEYQKKNETAMILTSHYMEDIERLCKRIMIMKEGALVYDGALTKILSDYAKYKVISIRLMKPVQGETSIFTRWGEVLKREPQFVQIKVLREEIPRAMQTLLTDLPVMDLSIEEESIGDIIEAIQR